MDIFRTLKGIWLMIQDENHSDLILGKPVA